MAMGYPRAKRLVPKIIQGANFLAEIFPAKRDDKTSGYSNEAGGYGC